MSRRTHDCIEQRERLDALDMRFNNFFVKFKRIPIIDRDEHTVKIPGNELHVERLCSSVGAIWFFVCPRCGSRRRFLYYPDLVCRDCAALNYEIQQRSHGDRQNCIDFLNKHLSGSEARPPGMRKKRYNRLMERYRKHAAAADERERRTLDADWQYAWELFLKDGVLDEDFDNIS